MENISLGLSGTIAMAMDLNNGHLYAAESGSDSVAVIDPAHENVITNISLSSVPLDIAYDSFNGYVYVAVSGSIAVIDSTTNTVVTQIPTDGDATHIIFDSVSGMLYASFSNNASGNGYVMEINGSTDSIQGNISGFLDPYGMAVDTADGNIYVADQGLQGVCILNGTTNTIQKSIGLKADALELAYDPAGGRMFLLDGYNVTVFNASSGNIISNISVANSIFSIVYDNSTGDVYVGGGVTGYIYVMDPANGGTVKMISISNGGTFMFYDWKEGSIYAAYTQYKLMIINATSNLVSGYMELGEYPYSIAYDGATGYAYIAETPDNRVQVINASSGNQVGFVNVGMGPGFILADPQAGKVFVSDYSSNQVSIINDSGLNVEKTVTVGTNPEGMALDMSTGTLYVMNMNSANITRINATTGDVLGSIWAGFNPSKPAFPYRATWDSVNHDVYFTNSYGSFVTVINTSTETVSKTIQVNGLSNGITFDSWNNELFVSTTNNTVNVVNTTTDSVVGNIPVGYDMYYSASSILFDPINGYVFYANGGSYNVTVIDGSTGRIAETFDFPFGSTPSGVAIDTQDGNALVTNYYADNITVLGWPTYAATFNETGLKSGNWYINITGSERIDSGPIVAPSYSFALPDGFYHYAASASGKYQASPASGNLTIRNSPYSSSIGFSTINGNGFNFLGIPFLALVVLVAVSISAYVVNSRRKKP